MSKFINDSNLALILGNFKTKMTDGDAATLVSAKSYADTKFAGVSAGISISVVAQLPTSNIQTTVIYFVPKTTTGSNNAYDEYMYIASKWEKLEILL